MDLNNVQLRHMRPEYTDVANNFGGVTIATHVNSNGSMYIAFAVCSMNDNFSKTIGREVALHRLENGDFITVANAKHWTDLDTYANVLGVSKIGRLATKLHMLFNINGLLDNAAGVSEDCKRHILAINNLNQF